MTPKLLDDILLFAEVINKKSFSAAARELAFSKSLVSKRISRLESNLGSQLINRSTRQLALTQVGEVLYEHALRIAEELKEAENAVTNLQSEPTGTIKMHAPLSFAHLHLVPAIAEFMSRYPDIEVDLSTGGNMSNLIEGGFDLAIFVGNPPDSNNICRKLTERGMRVCAAPSYLEKQGTPKIPKDLAEHNCLVYQELPHHESWNFVDTKGLDQFIEISGTFSATSSEALREAAVAGVGVVKLPGFMLTHEIKQKHLVPILEEFVKKDIGIHAMYPHSRQLAKKVRLFVDFLVERFAPEAYWS